MDIAIIASEKDPAGLAISKEIKQRNTLQSSLSFHLIKEELLVAENLWKKIEADIFIFASKHRSSSNTKSFAIHSIGNWGEANAGGKEKSLSPSCASLQLEILKALSKKGREGYEITMEATHHGPYMEKPSVFVEVGSTEQEWADPMNANILLDSILEGVRNVFGDERGNGNNDVLGNTPKNNGKVAIGIGGPHYCNNFNKLSLRKNIAFGHICPKHHLEKLDEDLLKQAIEKSHQKIETIILDWKGLGDQKQRMLLVCEKSGLKIERTDQILKE